MIPLIGAEDRTTPGGSVKVWETRDAGASWTARGDGLPEQHAYLTVLREAFDTAGEGKGLELYFGATSGDVFGSGDAGASWGTVAEHLPPVYSVRTARDELRAGTGTWLQPRPGRCVLRTGRGQRPRPVAMP